MKNTTPHEHSASESAAQPQEPQCLICLNNALINLRAQVKTLSLNMNELPILRTEIHKRNAVIEYLECKLAEAGDE